MGRIALLLPQNDLYEKVGTLLREINLPHQVEIARTSSVTESIETAKKLAETCDLFIVRGRVSHFIRENFDLPIINIEITPREMGEFFLQAKKLLKQAHPRIDVVCYTNSICDTTNFSEIFDIDLRCHLIAPTEDVGAIAAQADAAIADGAQLIIGSLSAVSRAVGSGIPSIHLQASEDALRNAFHIANITLYARDLEKSNAARLHTLIDNLYCGVIELDSSGNTVMFNTVAAGEFGFRLTRDKGKPLLSLTHAFPSEVLSNVLEKGEETFVPSVRTGHSILHATITPMFSGGEISGAIILCQKAKTVESMDLASRREDFRYADSPLALRKMKEFFSNCPEQYQSLQISSMSDAPLLLSGELGCEVSQMSRAIHAIGLRSGEPYLEVACDALSHEEQMTFLFGSGEESGNFIKMHRGTIFLNRADCLSPIVQSRIVYAIQHRAVLTAGLASVQTSVRVIAYIPDPFDALRCGNCSKELFYALNVLHTEVTPLRKRPKDLQSYFRYYLQIACEKYDRVLIPTSDAETAVLEYSWDGNLTQLSAFCEKLVLSAKRRSVGGAEVRSLILASYPSETYAEAPEAASVSREEQVIRDALQRHNWNRSATAQELNISKTTLWRKMNQHGIFR